MTLDQLSKTADQAEEDISQRRKVKKDVEQYVLTTQDQFSSGFFMVQWPETLPVSVFPDNHAPITTRLNQTGCPRKPEYMDVAHLRRHVVVQSLLFIPRSGPLAHKGRL
jgi:hypothetical protein